MKQVLEQLYQQLKERYGIMHHSWDMLHINKLNQAVWFKPSGALEESFLEEYQVWSALVPLFIEYNVAYAQVIDEFTDAYEKVFFAKIIETGGKL